jgi:hypothetical protein
MLIHSSFPTRDADGKHRVRTEVTTSQALSWPTSASAHGSHLRFAAQPAQHPCPPCGICRGLSWSVVVSVGPCVGSAGSLWMCVGSTHLRRAISHRSAAAAGFAASDSTKLADKFLDASA